MTDRLANAQERAIKMMETTFKQCYQEGYRDGQDIEQSNAVTTKEEVAKMEYERGVNAAWECALHCMELGYKVEILKTYSASECMAKIKEYEEKKKADEIKVGDEVDHDGLKCVVVKVWQDCICTISQVGTTPSYTDKNVLKKTGRHFDGIEKLMKELGNKE